MRELRDVEAGTVGGAARRAGGRHVVMGDGIRVERDVFAQERQLIREGEGAVARSRIVDRVLLQSRRVGEGEEALEEGMKGDGLLARSVDAGYRIDAAVSSSSPDDCALEAQIEVLRRLQREAEGLGPWAIRRRVTL